MKRSLNAKDMKMRIRFLQTSSIIRQGNIISSKYWVLKIILVYLCVLPCLFSMSKISGIISFLAFILYFFVLYITNLRNLIKYFPTYLGILLAVFAVFIIDYTTPYLIELRKQSTYYGAVPLFVEYYLILTLSLEVIDYRGRCKNIRSEIKQLNFRWESAQVTKKLINVLSYGLCGIILIMFFHIANKPFFILKVDRFVFRSRYITGIWLKIEKYMIYAIPILLMNWKNGHKSVIIVALTTLFIYYFWQGEKYSGFMAILSCILIYACEQDNAIRMIKRFLPKLVVLFLILLFIILLQYKILYGSSFSEVFSNRIAQQGQMWWATYGIRVGKTPMLYEIWDELKAYTNPESYNYGIYKMMYLVAPREVVTSKILSGSRYTESTAGSLYYYFGSMGLLAGAFVFGAGKAMLARWYYNSIKGNYIIEALFIAKIMNDYSSMTVMSDISSFISINNISKVVIIFVCYIIRYRMRKSRKHIEKMVNFQ